VNKKNLCYLIYKQTPTLSRKELLDTVSLLYPQFSFTRCDVYAGITQFNKENNIVEFVENKTDFCYSVYKNNIDKTSKEIWKLASEIRPDLNITTSDVNNGIVKFKKEQVENLLSRKQNDSTQHQKFS
jgi:hypothetical protein